MNQIAIEGRACRHVLTSAPRPQARLTGVSKLDDANEAGGRNGYKCTLIITEGDSAKALAISGARDAAEIRRRDHRRDIAARVANRSRPPGYPHFKSEPQATPNY